jgi:hypothetical protein
LSALFQFLQFDGGNKIYQYYIQMELKQIGYIFLGILLLWIIFSLFCNTSEGLTTPDQNKEKNSSPQRDVGGIKYTPDDVNDDTDNLSIFKNKELSGSEKEAKQTVFNPDLDVLDPSPVYFETGSFPFYENAGYVPKYEDSIYISKTTNLSQTTPITDASYLLAGFCYQYANDKSKLEAACNNLDKNVCSSTNCCALLGGQKCVAGNESGPFVSANYSDFTIQNKDYYYYQGKCYGNCSSGYSGPSTNFNLSQQKNAAPLAPVITSKPLPLSPTLAPTLAPTLSPTLGELDFSNPDDVTQFISNLSQTNIDLPQLIIDLSQNGVDLLQNDVDLSQLISDLSENGDDLSSLIVDLSNNGVDLGQIILDLSQTGVDLSKIITGLSQNGVDMYQVVANISNSGVDISQLSDVLSQNGVDITKFDNNLWQPSVSLSQPSVSLSQPSVSLSQPSSGFTYPTISLSQPSSSFTYPTVSLSQPSPSLSYM